MADDTNTAERDLVRIAECAARLVEHADFRLGGVLSADSKTRDIPSRACSQVKSRHLAALRDALAGRASLAASAGSEPDNAFPLASKIYKRGEEWVLEVSGTINDCHFTCRHTQPGGLQPEDVAGLPTLYTHPSPPEGMAGWKLVPIEPTLDMGWAYLDAARGSEPLRTHSFNHAGYRAMIAAAPPLPASEAKEL
ncbi:hypothetical protein [Acidovorax sp. Leaf73]|uniref:hypothetical protein n=1 Tax=Acidovorax sp. Leaf73 TaxID=2876566 RepID=UPI001E54219F|nr:hypothetical protein [Acidovorax sp. Leaf73]